MKRKPTPKPRVYSTWGRAIAAARRTGRRILARVEGGSYPQNAIACPCGATLPVDGTPPDYVTITERRKVR